MTRSFVYVRIFNQKRRKGIKWRTNGYHRGDSFVTEYSWSYETKHFTCCASFFNNIPPAGRQALPDLTKPQYAVMRSVAEQPGIEQVVLIEAAVSTKATLAEMLSRMEARAAWCAGNTIPPINAAVLSI